VVPTTAAALNTGNALVAAGQSVVTVLAEFVSEDMGGVLQGVLMAAETRADSYLACVRVPHPHRRHSTGRRAHQHCRAHPRAPCGSLRLA